MRLPAWIEVYEVEQQPGCLVVRARVRWWARLFLYAAGLVRAWRKPNVG